MKARLDAVLLKLLKSRDCEFLCRRKPIPDTLTYIVESMTQCSRYMYMCSVSEGSQVNNLTRSAT